MASPEKPCPGVKSTLPETGSMVAEPPPGIGPSEVTVQPIHASFARTSREIGVSNGVVAKSGSASETVTVTVAILNSPVAGSVIRYWNVVVPVYPNVGVKVTVPSSSTTAVPSPDGVSIVTTQSRQTSFAWTSMLTGEFTEVNAVSSVASGSTITVIVEIELSPVSGSVIR